MLRVMVNEYGEDGVDVTLIRWMLSLTPRKRLEFLEDRINDDVDQIRKKNASTWDDYLWGTNT